MDTVPGTKMKKSQVKRRRRLYARASQRPGGVYQPRRVRREWAAAEDARRDVKGGV